MKTLHLLRHAKSSWDDPQLADSERGLNARGRRDAPRIGRALAQRMAPMSIHYSPARRAVLTLEALCEGWPELGEQAHSADDGLYTFSADDLFDWIADRRDNPSALFIISHNPGLTQLVNDLLGDWQLDNLPTAGYTQLSLRIDRWHNLLQGCAELAYSLFPKQLDEH